MLKKPYSSFLNLCLFVVGLVFFIPSVSQADSLQQIEKDLRHMYRDRDSRSKQNMYGPKWFNVNSNYYKVFASQNGGEHLIDWLGYSIDGFVGSRASTQRKLELVKAQRVFSANGGGEVELEVFVPHPRFHLMAEYNLLEEYQSRRQPRSLGKLLEEFTIESLPARIYQTERGNCVGLLDLPLHSFLYLNAKSCTQRDAIRTLLKKFDIARISVKLVS